MKIDIFCTLGPNSLNKKFLKFSRGKINLFRINMSHVTIANLQNQINFIKKNSNIPICVDTEGAQIRTKVKKEKYLKYNKNLKIYKNKGQVSLYPDYVFERLRKNDCLELGFTGLEIKIKKKLNNKLFCKVTSSGYLEKNKAVHLKNRKIKMDYLTAKDLKAIELAKRNKIKHFALSFTNSEEDVKKFNYLLKGKIKIFKLETKSAIKNLKKIMKSGQNFLIDRGDLSKEVSIEQIPVAQRKIIRMGKKRKKNIYVATNFLESMILNNYPNRGEVNDIYSTLELGAKGLVLAAETAIGKNPMDSVTMLKKIIKIYLKNKNSVN
ncbi:MAG: hypothetical protein CMI79_04340 [Candidatus Pelagibacter sp.]|nr:hypothetical protein [Candidatus Pelagibacter sp.]|tara:strand:- start:7608 stop:8576 length:969 start_codon:yes stop_codon:yes gene_type:complete